MSRWAVLPLLWALSGGTPGSAGHAIPSAMTFSEEEVGRILEHSRPLTRSPFDEFVEGLRQGDPARAAALGPEARRGLKLFVGRAGCRVCHAGADFTDGQIHDRFETPTLRNVAVAALHEHRGPLASRWEIPLDERETHDLLEFLASLREIRAEGALVPAATIGRE